MEDANVSSQSPMGVPMMFVLHESESARQHEFGRMKTIFCCLVLTLSTQFSITSAATIIVVLYRLVVNKRLAKSNH